MDPVLAILIGTAIGMVVTFTGAVVGKLCNSRILLMDPDFRMDSNFRVDPNFNAFKYPGRAPQVWPVGSSPLTFDSRFASSMSGLVQDTRNFYTPANDTINSLERDVERLGRSVESLARVVGKSVKKEVPSSPLKPGFLQTSKPNAVASASSSSATPPPSPQPQKEDLSPSIATGLPTRHDPGRMLSNILTTIFGRGPEDEDCKNSSGIPPGMPGHTTIKIIPKANGQMSGNPMFDILSGMFGQPQLQWTNSTANPPQQNASGGSPRVGISILPVGMPGGSDISDMLGGGQKKNAKKYTPVNCTGTKFNDVKGCDEAKDEMKEVVMYLKDPGKFTRLGAKLPRGILMTGPPGTGKTLMARAVAGEANASFFQSSGSEFEEEFVGVGARRIRDLFEEARKHTPCIVFIDELDAVGGKRSAKHESHHRQTLNQLLTEVDGFKQNQGLVLIAATNFPESLDKALTRAGRLDKTIVLPIPDLRGRKDILALYAKNISLDGSVNLDVIAQRTTGMTGADLANILNIAAIRSSVDNLTAVPQAYLEEAFDRVVVGTARRSLMSMDEKNATAYHEGGHALVGMKTTGCDPVHKATILPRGSALGITWSVPETEKFSQRLFELRAKMDMMMGGRAAEELAFGKENVSAGCSSDLQKATDLARKMVMNFGMGLAAQGGAPVSMYYDQVDYQILSDQAKHELDTRIQSMLRDAYKRAVDVLTTNKNQLRMLAEALMEYETLDGEEIRLAITGKKAELQDRHTNLSTASNFTANSRVGFANGTKDIK